MAKDAPRKAARQKPSRTSARPAAADERQVAFTPDVLESTVIALPLLDRLEKDGLAAAQDIIVDVNRDYPGGRDKAQERIRELIGQLIKAHRVRGQGVHGRKTDMTRQYVFGRLRGDLIQELVRKDREQARKEARGPALYRVWPDFEVQTLTDRSIATVKADAARNAFGAVGRDILWAVVDSGIDAGHPHFRAHANLELDRPLKHCDFTTLGEVDEDASERAALTDEKGHGTHVAGIIAGALKAGEGVTIKATINRKDEQGKVIEEERPLEAISGMAPACRLISFKVLDKDGKGPVSNLIAACAQIQEINGNGRCIRIHGVNMSVGYDFEPSGSPAARAPCASRSTGWCAPAWWSSSPPATPATAGTSRRSAARRRPAGSHHQRPRQRRARDHRRLDPPRHAAHLRRLVLLVEGPDRRRPAQARPGGAGREDHLLRGPTAMAPA